ncbi:hypothetical protein ABPG72_021530 [Tetrahymena utriculariae]
MEKYLLTYNKWRNTHQRVYLNEHEQLFRQLIFFENLAKVNQQKQNANATYTIGLNKFSYTLMKNLSTELLIRNSEQEVKDYYNKVMGMITQLVDCVNQAGFSSDGQNGGFQQDGVEYVIKFGIVTEDEYPYTAVGGDCQITDPTSDGFYPKSERKLQKTVDDLKSGLNFSPVTVSVETSNWSSYESGIFDNCGETTEQQLNHALIVVDYDNDGNWIIRNSWSTSWGEDGYLRLAAGNTCGVLLDNLIVTA